MTVTSTMAIGQKVEAHGAKGYALAPDFPGWQTDNYADFFVSVQDGTRGTVTFVESHGMNPWTRYSVIWEDGSRSYGTTPDELRPI